MHMKFGIYSKQMWSTGGDEMRANVARVFNANLETVYCRKRLIQLRMKQTLVNKRHLFSSSRHSIIRLRKENTIIAIKISWQVNNHSARYSYFYVALSMDMYLYLISLETLSSSAIRLVFMRGVYLAIYKYIKTKKKLINPQTQREY